MLMKVKVVRHGYNAEESGESFSREGFREELIRQGQQEPLANLLDLSVILRQEIPRSLLLQVSLEEQVKNLIMVGLFLAERHEPVKIALIPRAESGRYQLLASSTDASHIFFSLQEYLHRRAYHFDVICHPILALERRDGELLHFKESSEPAVFESLIWLEIERLPESELARLEEDIRLIHTSALSVYRDHPQILARFSALSTVAGFEQYAGLFAWLQQENFIPVAYRSYLYPAGAAQVDFIEDETTALGLHLFYDRHFYLDAQQLELSPEYVFSLVGHGKSVDLEKTELRCALHRFERLTYLGFREDLGGGRFREHCFWGFYPQNSIDENAYSITPLRQRIQAAQQQLKIPRDGHNHRKTIQIINSFPKIELFLMDDDELRRLLRSFTQMHRQAGVKVVVTPGASEQGLTLLLIMPNEYYLPEHIERMEAYLRRYFKAASVDTRLIHLASDYLSLHANLLLNTREVEIDLLQLEQGLTRLMMPWQLKFRQLLEKSPCIDAESVWNLYGKAFDQEYRSRTHPRFAVRDVVNLIHLQQQHQDLFDIWGPFHDQGDYYRLQYYSLTRSNLNDLMPFLQNLDLQVMYEIDTELQLGERQVYIKSFAIRFDLAESLTFSAFKPLLIETLTALCRGTVENDYLHRLLPLTGLSWQQIDVFRAYRNYYFQLGNPFTKKRVAYALINNPAVSLLLFRYFEGRFNPELELCDPLMREIDVLSPIRQQLVDVLEAVSDPNEDRILRTLFNLIDSTIRSNFFVRCAKEDDFISFKIAALGVIDMPTPRPLYEVYVHSATMEGIHLRGGKVARGGIRWSERPDDFRTEVLGLVKAQMTKNAVIVPEGSKGGFITKRVSADRDQQGDYIKAAYLTLMRGLLDLTDNRVGEEIVRPQNVVAYDDTDPYLVVAADKGTAHLSDTANAVSAEYGFWLGDAFASGGSHGYDHKQLGITARGAWEGVKRHFRGLEINIQEKPFTVVGIGDMSGDVFGNGMLLSHQIKLLAAFDHRHIFLDPNPDPDVSWRERERLFDMPRSSWADYNTELISAGGGVFSRQRKDIPISPEVAAWLGVRPGRIEVDELIRLLLKAPVDLVWNGGIGTYVKSASQSHEEAGDKGNDAVRVDGGELRCKVFGEGGNLGMTQMGRIEFALKGGLLNSDSIDNSGGVDSSDHEVNLKILLQTLRHQGLLDSAEQGYELLAEVESDVCRAVLDNNYMQTLAISLDELRCGVDIEPFLDLLDRLGRAGLLDRRGEFLPSRKEVSLRLTNRLTRPELSVLLAYGKMYLYRALLDSDWPENPAVAELLYDYFPTPIVERYRDSLAQHPLAREITATVLTNRVVGQAGCAFVQDCSRITGRGQVEVACAYLLFDELLDGAVLRRAVFALDNRMSAERQYRLLLKLEALLTTFCHYALSSEMSIPTSSDELQRIRTQLDAYAKTLAHVLPQQQWQACLDERKHLEDEGLDPLVAYKFSVLDSLVDFLPLVCMGASFGLDVEMLARAKTLVHEKLAFAAIVAKLDAVPARNSWDRRARETLLSSLNDVKVQLVHQVVQFDAEHPERYFIARRQALRNFEQLRQALEREVSQNFHPFTVLLSAFEGLL
jgi:glutamate dehydrogenase